MYPHFITVHDGEDNQCEISVNIDNIVNFHVDEDGVSIIEVVSGEFYRITETYEELSALVAGAGCHIEKADPRLNTKQPLTMDEIRQMVGEPVWNSNTRSWGLVCDYYDETVAIKPPRGASYDYDADDLVKFPLYRMKEG